MEIFTLANITTFGMLMLLQVVLGFDNLLYISLESKKAPLEKQGFVRKVGIGIAILLRIVLLFALVSLIKYFEEPLFSWNSEGWISSSFNVHSLIVLLGGIFIIYTSIKEIWHMISYEPSDQTGKTKMSVNKAITLIVIMNVVFSFDSILSAMALTNEDQFWIMAAAIITGGILMIWLADKVANFLEKNRMYEVLGLFILFLVGIMLLSEGGHLAHLELFGNEITPMNKTTFYFILVILILVDIVQGQYQKRILQAKKASKK
ncbi:MAG: TerC family protein [Parvicellaceae bacterium]